MTFTSISLVGLFHSEDIVATGAFGKSKGPGEGMTFMRLLQLDRTAIAYKLSAGTQVDVAGWTLAGYC